MLPPLLQLLLWGQAIAVIAGPHTMPEVPLWSQTSDGAACCFCMADLCVTCGDALYWFLALREWRPLCTWKCVPLPQFTDSEYTFPQDLDKVFNCGQRILYQTRCVRSWPVGLLPELAQLEAWVLLLGLALFDSNWARSGTSGCHMHFLAKQIYKGIVPFHSCVLVHPFGLRGRLKVGLELWKQIKVQNNTQ